MDQDLRNKALTVLRREKRRMLLRAHIMREYALLSEQGARDLENLSVHLLAVSRVIARLNERNEPCQTTTGMFVLQNGRPSHLGLVSTVGSGAA